jgi:tRNA (mo5U34)-methyltransferase
MISASTASQREIQRLGPWFHNLHLPNGLQTAPDHALGDFPATKWQKVQSCIPEQLSGVSVLDIGCNAGFYSFELARRGATVLAIDTDPLYLKQARWAARELGLTASVCFEQASVYQLARSSQCFDLVLFMGVFYHLRHPLLALDIIASKVRRWLVFQTLTAPGMEVSQTPADLPLLAREPLAEPGWPRMAFIEHSLAGDPTNWWALNHAGALAVLRSSGLRVAAQPGHEIYVCEPDAAKDAVSAQLVERELKEIFGS